MSQKLSTKRPKEQSKQQSHDSVPPSATTIQRKQAIPAQPSFNSSKKEGKVYQKAIEDYRKLCLKTYASPNPAFVSILKTEMLSIFLASYNLKEINCLNKIIGRYQYFKELILAPHDPQKADPNEKKKRGFGIVTPLTPAEQEKANKDLKEQAYAKNQKVYTIVQGVAKNICLSTVLTRFTLYGMSLGQEHTSFLSEGLIENKSLVSFTVSNCQIPIEAYEILLKGLLTHERIEYVDLSGNNFNDKYANMISRIIARQTQRRDLVIWSYGLRNERPLTNDYTRGLICLNLSNNDFSDIAADTLTNALSYDQYIRSIDLSGNSFSKESCKKFIRMLRKNSSMLSLDLKDNPGYDPEIHARMVMKMSKNIQHLNQQVVDNQFSIEEFNELKQFINLSFFNVDIPEEVIEMYNSQVSLPQQSQQMSVNSNNNTNGDRKKNAAAGKESDDKKKGKKKEEEKYDNGGEGEGDEEEQYDDAEEGEGEENDEMENITEGDIEKLIMSNRNLLAENVQLKKEMIEMRAGKLKNSINQSKSEAKGNNQNTSQIESNYNRIVDLLTELTDLMDNVETSMKKGGSEKSKESNQSKPQQQQQQQKVASKNKPKEGKGGTIGEESEEHEQASSRITPNDNQKQSQKDPKQQAKPIQDNEPKTKAKESPKQERPSSSKKPMKAEEEYDYDDNEEHQYFQRRQEGEEEEYEEAEDDDEEYLDEEDMRQNIYSNPYKHQQQLQMQQQQMQQQQYMMYADEDDEDDDDMNPMNQKINKSF